MKNFLIIVLIIGIVGGTGYAVYYQVDQFNKEHNSEIAKENTTTNRESEEKNEELDVNSEEVKELLNILDINPSEQQENVYLQGIFTNLEGENTIHQLDNETKQQMILFSAMKNNLIKEVSETENPFCLNGCKAVLVSDANKFAKDLGINDLDSIYPQELRYNGMYLSTWEGDALTSTLSHNLEVTNTEKTITLIDHVTIYYNDTALANGQKENTKNKTIQYEFNKQSDNTYTLSKIIVN